MDQYACLPFGGQKIFTRLACPDLQKKYPTILFIHGSGSSLVSFTDLINRLKKEFVCLAFDHLGCGQSAGNFADYSLKSRYDQAKYLLTYWRKLKNVDQDQIAVLGSSMGGHVAARLAGTEPVKWLILRAPSAYRQDYEEVKMTPGWLPWDRETQTWPWQPSKALEAISTFNGSLLIVKSEKDEVIPDEVLKKYFQVATKTKVRKLVTIKDAPHKVSDKPLYNQEFFQTVYEFLTKAN